MPDKIIERRFGGLTVRIDRDQCIGNQSCIAVAPEVFELDDEQAVAFREDAKLIERQRLIEACQSCPVSALLVIDEEGNEIVP
jgi:ferredoxin